MLHVDHLRQILCEVDIFIILALRLQDRDYFVTEIV